MLHGSSQDGSHALVRKLESIVELGPEEREALGRVAMTVRELRAGQDLVRDGERPSHSCLIIEGLAARYKLVGEDRRQILAFHVPGEIPDLQSLYLKTLDHDLGTLTQSRVGFIQHRDLFGLMTRYPRIKAAFWRETLIDAAIFREWMIGLGRRRAVGRIAHLFCELFVRLQSIGQTQDQTIRLPITQEELGDALGLSAVHTNRSLQELRAQGLFTFEGGRLTILDWDGLRRIGEFEPGYLHFRRAAPE